MERNYIELNGESTTKITPIKTKKGTFYKVKEVLYLDNKAITITYDVDRFGKAISDIENSYFAVPDTKEKYNVMGAIWYKMNLLKRIQENLKEQQYLQSEMAEKTR